MGRKDNNLRVSVLTGGVQLLTRVNAKTILGLTMTARRMMLHERNDPFTDIFKPDNSHYSESYFSNLIFQSRHYVSLKSNRLFISCNVFFPLSNDAEVVFKNQKNQDALFSQVNAQFILFRRFSGYFSLNRGINATYRITGKPVNKMVMRGFLIPVFQQRLSSSVFFSASAELNMLLVKPFFNSLYLNEKVEVLVYGPFGISYSFQYGYYALGKNVNAQHSFNVSLKREFHAFPIIKFRKS